MPFYSRDHDSFHLLDCECFFYLFICKIKWKMVAVGTKENVIYELDLKRPF